MQHFFIDNKSADLILFFAGWGCDEHQFVNLKDMDDVVILYDYCDLNLDFDFAKYNNIRLIAYSAGVFVASIIQDKLPDLCKKTAVCGNPYLFDEKLGLSESTVELLKNVNLDNYLEFRRKYMVFDDDEYAKYNQLQSLRSVESCQEELVQLQALYAKYKSKINPVFDVAIMAEDDLFFNIKRQKDFYGHNLVVIPKARHHIFFHFKSFREIADIKAKD